MKSNIYGFFTSRCFAGAVSYQSFDVEILFYRYSHSKLKPTFYEGHKKDIANMKRNTMSVIKAPNCFEHDSSWRSTVYNEEINILREKRQNNFKKTRL